jgi:hypothetical protein
MAEKRDIEINSRADTLELMSEYQALAGNAAA